MKSLLRQNCLGFVISSGTVMIIDVHAQVRRPSISFPRANFDSAGTVCQASFLAVEVQAVVESKLGE
jgi:hypothetical protein